MAVDEPDAEARAAARQREQWRHTRTAITLLVLVGVVVVGAWISWRNVTSSESDETVTPQSSCLPGPATAAPAPRDIQLNVYNATQRSGLAAAVAGQMQERGFAIVDIANDPLNKTITSTAEVRSGPDQQAAASLIASMVPGAVYVADERTTPTVDLVLGEAFDALGAAAEPTATSTLPPCEPPAG